MQIVYCKYCGKELSGQALQRQILGQLIQKIVALNMRKKVSAQKNVKKYSMQNVTKPIRESVFYITKNALRPLQ
ncbi:MAG TPA: hypothetical protein DIS62_07580, partial [Candidatus Kerfeldbacteria bacterium]|nr:hypothetical protein [Candidatus Kerfeldbacteria bacterium]